MAVPFLRIKLVCVVHAKQNLILSVKFSTSVLKVDLVCLFDWSFLEELSISNVPECKQQAVKVFLQNYLWLPAVKP